MTSLDTTASTAVETSIGASWAAAIDSLCINNTNSVTTDTWEIPFRPTIPAVTTLKAAVHVSYIVVKDFWSTTTATKCTITALLVESTAVKVKLVNMINTRAARVSVEARWLIGLNGIFQDIEVHTT